jgi:hypothetical protein
VDRTKPHPLGERIVEDLLLAQLRTNRALLCSRFHFYRTLHRLRTPPLYQTANCAQAFYFSVVEPSNQRHERQAQDESNDDKAAQDIADAYF